MAHVLAPRLLVAGDVHGYLKALQDALKKASFDPSKDRLLFLGDLVDRGPRAKEVLDYLLYLKRTMPPENLILVRGNHDQMFLSYLQTNWEDPVWLDQGARETLQSYPGAIPVEHKELLLSAKNYHLENNQLFVHAGIDQDVALADQREGILFWDRNLVASARAGHSVISIERGEPYWNVFVGHTPTTILGSDSPLHFENLYMLDCGVAWGGHLAVMDAQTKEYWVSFRTGASERLNESDIVSLSGHLIR